MKRLKKEVLIAFILICALIAAESLLQTLERM